MKKLHLFRLLFAAMFVTAATAFTSCSNDDDDEIDFPSLEVSASELNFDENGGSKTFDITTTGRWVISGAESESSWLGVTPALTGNGNATINVTVAPSDVAHKATLKVTVFTTIFGVEKEVTSKDVTINQTSGGVVPVDEVIWAETCGTTGTSATPHVSVADYTGWDKSGVGASTVTYSGTNTSVRSTGLVNNASGHSEIFFSTSPASFVVNKITLTAAQTKLQLSFIGSRSVKNGDTYDNTFDKNNFKVALSADGTNWTDIEYTTTGGESTPYWVTATSNFTLKEAVSELYIRFTATESSVYRIDDMKLETGIGGAVVDLEGGTPPSDAVAITIPEIIAKLTAEQVVLDAANDRYFEAVVVTDKEGGNVNENNLQVMTPGATTAGNGITLYGSGQYTNPRDENFTLKKGDKVKVTLKAGKARIVNYQGLYEVTGNKADEWVVIEKTGTVAIDPVTITPDKLAQFQGMVVTLADAKAPATATAWCESDKFGQHIFTVGGSNVTVFVQANMPELVGQSFTANATGSVTGYATVYQNNAQICPQVPANVAAFMGEPSTDPAISKVDPASLTFAAVGESKTVTVTTVNTDDTYTIAATSDKTQFTPTVNGKVITVVAAENTTDAAITGTLTINLMKGTETVDTKTVSMTQSKAVSGDVTVVVADFNNEAGYPSGFPILKVNMLIAPTTFNFGGYDFTFAGSSDGGYYVNYTKYNEKEDPYLLIGKQGAYIEMPAIAGKALSSVKITLTTTASKKVTVGVADDKGNFVSGGESILLDQKDGQVYTYDLTGTAADTKYRLLVANSNNVQFYKLELSYN